jgi:hypothetical protein
VRSRLMLGTALLAVPLLAACGGASDTGGSTATGSSPATAGAPESSSAPAAPASPSGPVLSGDVYTMTLPQKAEIDDSSPAWSRAWSLDLDAGGFGLDGQAMEVSCDGCSNTAQTRAKLARQAVHGTGKVLADVTVNGVTLFHATKGSDALRTDYYGADTGGQQFQLVFTSTHPYKETGPIIAATLASLQLRQ